MEIRIEPYTIKVDSESNVCHCCNSLLHKEIKRGIYLIGDECGYCRYLDRPFGGCGNTASSHYDGCSCEYGQKEFLYISCKKCSSPSCVKCGGKCYCSGEGCNEIICSECIEKATFIKNWNKSTPTDKLDMYGLKKLRILAKSKHIKGFSKYRRTELIDMLKPFVNGHDFPIRGIQNV